MITERIETFFSSAHLRFVELLRETAQVEHALAIQYLSLAFSVYPEHADVIGEAHPAGGGLLGIAVDEMKHLARINEVLAMVGAGPEFGRPNFPTRFANYPMEFRHEGLTEERLLSLILTEAPDLEAAETWRRASSSEIGDKLRRSLRLEQERDRDERLGTLYAELRRLTNCPEVLLSDPLRQKALAKFNQNTQEGERRHFEILLRIWETHFVAGDVCSLGGRLVVPTESSCWFLISRLADLTYCLICMLLQESGMRDDSQLNFRGLATDAMSKILHPIGRLLAHQGYIQSFNGLPGGYRFPIDEASTNGFLCLLADEIEKMLALIASDDSNAVSTLKEWDATLSALRSLTRQVKNKLSSAAALPIAINGHLGMEDGQVLRLVQLAESQPAWIEVKVSGELMQKFPRLFSDNQWRLFRAPSTPPLGDDKYSRIALFFALLDEMKNSSQGSASNYFDVIVGKWKTAVQLANSWEEFAFKFQQLTETVSPQFVVQVVRAQQALYDNCYGAGEDADITCAGVLPVGFSCFGTGTLAWRDISGFALGHVHMMEATSACENYVFWHSLNRLGQLHLGLSNDLSLWQKCVAVAFAAHERSHPQNQDGQRYSYSNNQFTCDLSWLSLNSWGLEKAVFSIANGDTGCMPP